MINNKFVAGRRPAAAWNSKSAPSKRRSDEKSKAASKSEEGPKVKAVVKKKKGKKITKIDIKLKKEKALLNAKKKGSSKGIKLNKKADRVKPVKVPGVSAAEDTAGGRRLEMLKVKPAADPHKKMELEHDLNVDYPLNETVEIRNWEGTFAPIHGEPYVAPLHQQPDSFWDAIYRSTDTDLPIPAGADVSYVITSPSPTLAMAKANAQAHAKSQVHVDTSQEQMTHDIEMKNKDKGKKEKKKPKLSIKEKKQKKKEKQENRNVNNLIAPGNKIKAAGHRDADSLKSAVLTSDHTAGQVHPQPDQLHASHAQPLHVAGPPPHSVNHIKAAGKSDDNLKTPSEEERESGTTYKPEGAYEYPSFRHPDFNPDTAYDENGIPIHESPGWTEPPTLPGDRRFGKERARPGASAGLAAHTHVVEQVLKPQAAHLAPPAPAILHHADQPGAVNTHIANHETLHHGQEPGALNTHLATHETLDHGNQPGGLNAHLANHETLHLGQEPGALNAHVATHEHQQMAAALVGSHLHPETHQDVHSQLLIDPHPPQGQTVGDKPGTPLILPAQHRGPSIRENVINHNIHKRETAGGSGESLECISSVMSTRELHRHAASYNQRQAALNNQAYSAYPDSHEEVVLDDKDPLAAYEQEKKARTTPAVNTKKKTVKSVLPSTPRFKLRPRFTTKSMSSRQPYTGFVLGRRRRRELSRPHTPATTARPPPTTWWPPGVPMRSRPTIPLHVMNPDILKWDMKIPPLWIRTGKTIKTYPPHIENYPVTFNWNVPRASRQPRYTFKPGWPLNSPVFGSVYDYLEEPSYPPVLASGETEFPITSPEPWWTYPPWWSDKLAAEANGTTPRPTRGPRLTRRTTTVPPVTTTPHDLQIPSTPLQTKRVRHHTGPWWKLTVVEHPASPTPTAPTRVKRFIKNHKPLRRQNAIRRKWRRNVSKQAEVNKHFTNETQYFQKNTTHHWSKELIEQLIETAIDELEQHISNRSSTHNNVVIDLSQQLSLLHNMFISSLYQFYDNNCDLLLELLVKELKIKLFTSLHKELIQLREKITKLTNKRKSPDTLKSSRLLKFKMINHFELFCKYNVISEAKISHALNLFNKLYEPHYFKLCDCKLILNSPRDLMIDSQGKNDLHYLTYRNCNTNKRSKREGKIIDLNQSSFNWSSQSMEKIVDELVEELPMKTIQKDVKADIIAEVNSDRFRKAGKTVNAELFSKMIGLDLEDSKIEKATLDSVKEVIFKLLKEVLTNLRENKWMKEAMVRLFEQGYSVDSVVDAITSEISIESLVDSLKGGAINITQKQEQHVLSQFKDYKKMLTKMIKREVLLWEYQLSKNFTDEIDRPKRSVGNFGKKMSDVQNFGKEISENIRFKRNIDDNEISHNPANSHDLDGDFDIDDELSAIGKSSMSEDKKIMKLKQRLKWLQSQTENPADITFPDDFEEQLMRTEGYDNEKTRAPRISKQRFQWNVRTRKPTVKVVTFMPKIRLSRGKPFIPLTTTESALVLPETFPPTRRLRTKRTFPTKSVKSDSNSNLQTFRRQFWMDYTQKTSPPRVMRRPTPYKRVFRTTPRPLKTLATVKTFRTIKFSQRTQQPVISLQEFLKRRNEFRKERDDGMWKRNMPTSSEETASIKKQPQREVSEEEDDLTELSFEAKLSGEVNAADFTLRPLSDFLYTKVVQTTVSYQHGRVTKSTSKPTRRRFTKRTGYTRLPRIKQSRTTPSTAGAEHIVPNSVRNPEGERTKREISTSKDMQHSVEDKAQSQFSEASRKQSQNLIDAERSRELADNGTGPLIRKPSSALVHRKPSALLGYFYRIKDCVQLRKTQLVTGVRHNVNQAGLERAVLWVLGYVAKAYHYLRRKVEEHADDSMEGKDLSLRQGW